VLPVDPGQRIEAATLRAAFATGLPAATPVLRAAGPPPTISVVLNTCAQPDSVLRAVHSVLACDPPPLEVIVVDNRPVDSPVPAALGEAFGPDVPVRYLEEPCPGLSSAR